MILILHSFGGTDGSSKHNDIYKIDTTGFYSSIINPKNPDDGPMKKCRCGMVPYKRSLVIFGGYVDAPTHPQPGASYQDGWTNELHILDLVEGEWLLVLIVLSGLLHGEAGVFFRGGW